MLFTATVPEVPAKHHGLALVAEDLQVGDAILPHIGKQFRNCVCVSYIITTTLCYVCVFVISGA